MDPALPYCLDDTARPGTQRILAAVVQTVPAGSKLFLVGGALRNSMFYLAHQRALPRRDYDFIFIGDDKEQFERQLLKIGFDLGTIQRSDQTSFEQPRFPSASSLNDYVVLDITYKHDAIAGVLAKKINFTINGFALELAQAFQSDWQDYLITIPHAQEDIDAAQLRRNPAQDSAIAYANLFAAIRFISQGFKAPPADVIAQMVQDAAAFPEEKFAKNVQKLVGYVGGEEKVRQICQQLDIRKNILNYDELKSPTNR